MYYTRAYSLQETTTSGSNTDFCFDWSNIDDNDCSILQPFREALRASQNNQTSDLPAQPSTAKIQNVQDSYNSGDQPIQAYAGTAIVITGGITSVSGGEKKHKSKWEDGSFQYVPFWRRFQTGGVENGLVTVSDDTIPWVRPRTYRFTFEEEQDEYYQNEVSLAGGAKN